MGIHRMSLLIRGLLICGPVVVLIAVGPRGGSASAEEDRNAASQEVRPSAEAFLREGNLAEGERLFNKYLQSHAADDVARLELGMIQFVNAVERLGKDLFRYGLRPTDRATLIALPIVRLPIPPNPDPEVLSNEEARRMLVAFIHELSRTETTLAAIKDENVKLRLPVGEIRLRFAPGASGSVSIREIVQQLRIATPAAEPRFSVAWDRADVAWLRGYCHLLSGFCEFVLAHDTRELFDHTAHIFFAKPQTPFNFLTEGRKVFDVGAGIDIVDLVAFVHLILLPLSEPQRMKSCREHWKQMLLLSREMWRYVQLERDDDDEWIPNPRQRGALNIRVSEEMIASWLEFVGEAERVLNGECLIPFWRSNDPNRGINLWKVFEDPRPFDLVLWLQGTAAAPYLEQGTMTDRNVWGRLRAVFGNQLYGFGVWFN